MTVDMTASDEAIQYVRQTWQRISQLKQLLDNLQQGQDQDFQCLIESLDEQEQVSQEAGFAGIARLIRDMSGCLRGTAAAERSLSAGTIGALLDACQCIVLHAEAVEAGLYPIRHAHEP